MTERAILGPPRSDRGVGAVFTLPRARSPRRGVPPVPDRPRRPGAAGRGAARRPGGFIGKLVAAATGLPRRPGAARGGS